MQKKSGVVFIKRSHLVVTGFIILIGGISIVGNSIKKYPGGDSSEVNAQVETIEKVKDKITEEKTKVTESEEKKYIKWVEFHVTKEAMQQAYEYDINTHNTDIPLHFVELLSYLGAKYGGDFRNYKPEDMEKAAVALCEGKTTMEQLTKDMKYYSYYREAYGAVLDGMVGEYQISEASETKEDTTWVTKYGLKAFHPIGKGFPYSDYDDFGASRSYGYKRNHLGHDMMGQVGTPVIAVESGRVAELGWNIWWLENWN